MFRQTGFEKSLPFFKIKNILLLFIFEWMLRLEAFKNVLLFKKVLV